MLHCPPCHLVQPSGFRGARRRYVETSFTTGQRNIFRQAAQKRADISLVKMTSLTERYNLKYTFDVYNLTNTTSFDVPGNEVFQNQYFNQFPAVGGTALPPDATPKANRPTPASITARPALAM
jgi:hypothetical protein